MVKDKDNEDWDGKERRGHHDLVLPDWIRNSLIGIGVGLVANIISVTWWAATLTTNQSFMSNQIQNLTSDLKGMTMDRYRAADAARDFAVVVARIDRVEDRVSTMEHANEKPNRG
jgi:hypothetical protein